MLKAAEEARQIILEVYSRDFDVETKDDLSPVTEADKRSDKRIREILKAEFPEYGFLTEESSEDNDRLHKEDVFIVDPLDGTMEFVKRNGEFCINIAYAHRGQIMAGVIDIPMQNEVYFASKGRGAFKKSADGMISQIHVSKKKENFLALKSRSHFTPREEERFNRIKDKISQIVPLGSAIKFTRIAEGKADVFFRLEPLTKEWDVAPGVLLVEEAGGYIADSNGRPFLFNKENVVNENGYMMANSFESLIG